MLAATFHALVVLALWSVGTVFQQSLVSELNGGPLLSGGFINLPSSPASQNKVPKRREIFSLTQQTTPARQGRLIVFDGGIYILERRKRSVEKSVKNESRGSDEDERGTNASMLRKGIFKGFIVIILTFTKIENFKVSPLLALLRHTG
jgi:hypothetical protein